MFLWNLTIEDIFLTYCRFIEGYDLRISRDEEISPEFTKVGSKYKYKNVARWISAGFLGRVSLDSRIKRVDEKFHGIIAANSNDIIKTDSPVSFYSKIVKTRNYYSHFKPDSTGILSINELYNLLPVMNTVITAILLSEIGIASEISFV